MKNRGKILLALVMVLIMVVGMFAITASAATIPAKTKLYLKPSANWKKDNARFAAYFFGNGDAWVSMTDPDGDGIYECESPNKSYTNVIFCRMNPNATANNALPPTTRRKAMIRAIFVTFFILFSPFPHTST